jgi:hypothetical protein
LNRRNELKWLAYEVLTGLHYSQFTGQAYKQVDKLSPGEVDMLANIIKNRAAKL